MNNKTRELLLNQKATITQVNEDLLNGKLYESTLPDMAAKAIADIVNGYGLDVAYVAAVQLISGIHISDRESFEEELIELLDMSDDSRVNEFSNMYKRLSGNHMYNALDKLISLNS